MNINNNNYSSKLVTLTVRKRLILGFALISFILIVSMMGILTLVNTSKYFATEVVTRAIPNYTTIAKLDEQLYRFNSAYRGWLLTNDAKFKREMTDSLSTVDQLIKAGSYVGANRATEWAQVRNFYNQLNTLSTKTTVDKSNTTGSVEASENIINGILTILKGPVNNGVRTGGIVDTMSRRITDDSNQVVDDMNLIVTILYITLVCSVLLSIAIALYTAKKILPPLNNAIEIAKKIAKGERNNEIIVKNQDETGELLTALGIMQESIKTNEKQLQQSEEKATKLFENIVQTANAFSVYSSKVAAGDLTQRLEINTDDEMSKLGHDLNTMAQGLASISKNIAQASNNMTESLEEVKQSSDQQSAGVSQQAASINEITASLEEIDKSAAQTMEKAKVLGELAEATNEKGQAGLQAVFDSIEGMKAVRNKVETIAKNILDLSNQTQQVGEITAVVNTLAQQSKMLALNASIEAAKAGDSGKGFAVVATEIKNLAEQSEQSTVEVQRILEDIRRATEKAVLVTEEGTKGVDHGTSLVEQMGEIVRSLTQAISETKIASQQIEAAVRQESLGIEQITTGMNEINQVTSSFVTTVKQTSASITQLSRIAKNIKEYVDIYKVG